MARGVLIYCDAGADARCVEMSEAFFRHALPARPVRRVLADELLAGKWLGDTALLVLPGGADLPYVAKLRGNGDALIRAFVEEHGGAYVGLCAGAYYAASRLLFDAGGPLQVAGARELAFFPGTAVGPVFPGFSYGSLEGCRAARVTLVKVGAAPHSDLGSSHVYFNGGCTFAVDPIADHRHLQVAATYAELDAIVPDVAAALGSSANAPPAAIVIKCGRGHVFLSGVHFEYNPARLGPDVPFPPAVAGQLAAETINHNAEWAGAWLAHMLAGVS